MKMKRQRDAEAYQKILKEQIDEKNKRNLNTNNGTIRTKSKISGIINKQRMSSKNTPADKINMSPAVASSRYSNTNTACTRDLFTPSEENCLSQHLANYSSKKPRVISESD